MLRDEFDKLLTIQNAKTVKGQKLGYLTGILYMTPARGAADGANLCIYSTAGCRAACLNTAGRGRFSSVQEGRARKRAAFLRDQKRFVHNLYGEIARLERRAKRLGLRAVVRLNGTTDIPWETVAPGLFTRFPRVRFYDYTKDPNRVRAMLAGIVGGQEGARPWPRNYDLTYSRAEHRSGAALALLDMGARVAVVFSSKRSAQLPRSWEGYRVKDGDRHDLRFLERAGVVGLRAKGRARQEESGFVVKVGGAP